MSEALLLSGGMDSVALAVLLKPAFGFTINYGQRPAAGELRAAKQVCSELGIEHVALEVNCSALGSGDMAGLPPSSVAPVPEWWPFRNQLLVTLGAMKAISLGVGKLIVGSVKGDGQHADGTAQFYHALDDLLRMQEGSIRVEAPALGMTTAELIRHASVPRSLLGWTHSCHREEFACGRCRGCYKHMSVLAELGIGDSDAGVTSSASNST